MLKEHEGTLASLQKFVDTAIIFLCWFLAFFIRFRYISGAQLGLELTYLKLSLVLVFTNFYFFHRHGLYRSLRFTNRMAEIGAVLKANAFSFIAAILIFYFISPERVSRLTLGLYFLLSSIILVFTRILIRNYLRSLRRKGRNLRNILLIGHGPQMKNYVETIRKYKDAGLQLVGWVDGKDLPAALGIPVLNDTISNLKKNFHLEYLIIGYPASEQHLAQDLITKEYNDIINIQIIPDIANTYLGHDLSDFGGMPIITINGPTLSWLDHFLKRLLDFLGAMVGLIILSPIFIILGIIIKITSPGPIFFGQERVTLNGKKFNMWKFRSMKTDAETQTGAVWAVQNDPRRTKIGRFLRETSLDELPQLWNVLVGDMSLVGPRPERPIFVEKFRHNIPAYMLRHKMRSGITGWAQVNGWRGDTSLEKRIEFDIYYIKHWSFWLDIKILVMTIWSGFINKNAY